MFRSLTEVGSVRIFGKTVNQRSEDDECVAEVCVTYVEELGAAEAKEEANGHRNCRPSIMHCFTSYNAYPGHT